VVLVVAGVLAYALAAAVFRGELTPPEWLLFLGPAGVLLPGLVMTTVGIALLVAAALNRFRPRLATPAHRGGPAGAVAALGWALTCAGLSAAAYFGVATMVEQRSDPCLDASCNPYGYGVAALLGGFALVTLPVAVLLFGLAQVLRAPGVPVR